MLSTTLSTYPREPVSPLRHTPVCTKKSDGLCAKLENKLCFLTFKYFSSWSPPNEYLLKIKHKNKRAKGFRPRACPLLPRIQALNLSSGTYLVGGLEQISYPLVFSISSCKMGPTSKNGGMIKWVSILEHDHLGYCLA